MLTKFFPYSLSISGSQMLPDNGLPHISLEVGVEDTKHEGLFSLKKFLFFRFITWSVVGVQDITAFVSLGNYE